METYIHHQDDGHGAQKPEGFNLNRANGRLAALTGKSRATGLKGDARASWLAGFDSVPRDRRGAYKGC